MNTILIFICGFAAGMAVLSFSKFIKNKTVLDYGCGGGYGTEYLSRFTRKTVFGFDISNLAISSASSYFSKANLKFLTKLPNRKFDVIVSFQVIEHLNKDQLIYYLNKTRLYRIDSFLLHVKKALEL